jgi:hypothetical protein
MIIKGMFDREKNEEEEDRASQITQKGDFAATTTTILCSKVSSN